MNLIFPIPEPPPIRVLLQAFKYIHGLFSIQNIVKCKTTERLISIDFRWQVIVVADVV